MFIPAPSALPTELLEQIIDEFLAFEPSDDTGYGTTTAIPQPQALSSLACVSHIVRQRVNAHRFSTVSFYKRDSSLADVHAFFDLLRSDARVALSMGITRHIRKLELVLGVRGEASSYEMVAHPAIDDGSFIAILNTVFRGGNGYPYLTSEYALALYGFTEWQGLNPDFITSIENILDNYVTTLDLMAVNNLPPALVKRGRIKHLKIGAVEFSVTPQYIADFTALGSWNQLESLDIQSTDVLNLVDRGDLLGLKALTITFLDFSLPKSLLRHWRHWNLLEDLTLNLQKESISSSFALDYKTMPNLKRLTIVYQPTALALAVLERWERSGAEDI